jgi:rhamnosyltransferase
MDKPLVSIIIRAKNEEKWIGTCLKSVFKQTYKPFEVILVDNQSSDKTVEKAKKHDVQVVSLDKFKPGRAINCGVRAAKGDIIVCLSAHCIAVDHHWLKNLVRNFKKPQIAGVYGRQEPMSFSSDVDKRDLTIVFGLDRKVQKKDCFFHNANSAFRRDIWEKMPFDEQVTNIEDRVWAKQVLMQGYLIVYDPEASVYHYHGIHQGINQERVSRTVRVLESLEDKPKVGLNIHDREIVALIPLKGKVQYCGKTPLVEITIRQALNAPSVDRVVVSTDNAQVAGIARKCGAEVPFMRSYEMSLDHVGLEEVLRYSVRKMESANILADLLVIMEATYPLRPEGLIDRLVEKCLEEGLDSVVPVKPEFRSVWMGPKDEVKMMGDGYMPRQFKTNKAFINLVGMGCVTHPQFVREGQLLGPRVGIVEVTHPLAHLEVRDSESARQVEKLVHKMGIENLLKKS